MPTRRTVLLAGAALMAACTSVPVRQQAPAGHCVSDDTLPSVRRLGAADLPYEMDGRPRSYPVDPAFLSQLDGWLTSWDAVSGAPPTTAISTYGIWTSGDCSSWHAAGRAFDIATVRSGDTTVVSCRHDRWRTETSDDPARATAAERALQRSYWRLTASLHSAFAYVLTYHFDEAHDNHIHVDNSVSQGLPTSFDPASRVQCQAVAAIATWVHGVTTPITGTWDATTQASAAAVLNRLGITGRMTDQATWQAFLAASAKG